LAKLLSFFCLFFISLSGFVVANDLAITPPTQKKTILVLSSTGGGGHIVASNTLETLVGQEYDLKIVYPINQLRIWGVPSCEQVYNAMLRNGWVRSMNFIVRHVCPPVFHSRLNKIEKIISSYIESSNPDLVISLIPFINYPASEAARKNGLPFLLVTTDNDLSNWAFEMEKVKNTQMRVTIGSDIPATKGVLLKKNIPESAIETIGLPLRPDFIAQKDEKKILDELHLPANKEIILIMMGGAGGDIAYEYAKKIGGMNLGAHLVVIAGRNNKLKKDLEQLKLHPSNTLTAFGFTNRISDLMAVSDLVITKPGPGTINEAMAMKLPILIDSTASSLFWERTNVDLVLKYGIGQRIKKFHQVKELITSYLKDPVTKQKTEELFESVPPNQFHLRMPEIIREMIALRELTLESNIARTIEADEAEQIQILPASVLMGD
jgi:processive 1,2-diacylglycerol beta-glucosyltransferase